MGVCVHARQRASLAVAGVRALTAFVCAQAQTRVKTSAIKPGTEQVQLINNGGFQSQGTLTGGDYPNPTGWLRNGNTYATAGVNTVVANSGVVAQGRLDTGAVISGYDQ